MAEPGLHPGQPGVVDARAARPLPVSIDYGTALVIEGQPSFFADLYGHDRLLDRALRETTRPAFPAP